MSMIAKKFVKAFITGGLMAVSAALALGVKVSSLEDLKGLGIILLVAFLSGSIHALIEAMNPTKEIK